MKRIVRDKKELRRLALLWRDGIPEADREAWSREIQGIVTASRWYTEADVILSYASFRSEVVTDGINERALRDGKRLYLPKTYPSRREMIFYQVRDLDCIGPGYQGIREPLEREPWTPPERDAARTVLMLMPGAAYDRQGGRIGYGGGYYDRFLESCGKYISHKVMLAFAGQQMPEIPVEECDIPPDRIITEPGCESCVCALPDTDLEDV